MELKQQIKAMQNVNALNLEPGREEKVEAKKQPKKLVNQKITLNTIELVK